MPLLEENMAKTPQPRSGAVGASTHRWTSPIAKDGIGERPGLLVECPSGALHRQLGKSILAKSGLEESLSSGR